MREFWPVPDALDYLTGRWRADRTVRDLAGDEEGRFEGTVVFGPLEGGGLLQSESGDFTWRVSPGPPSGPCAFCPVRAARRTYGSRTAGPSTAWTSRRAGT
ncbi:hypothetical protein SHKM778_64050 [Streptomyces sp. KM77-8]|uniref:DUF6314 domain-containing protein n=1 Tax=Streptomyces haneummycinicus TaxID=3074435 RepID=A0AAT9HRD1_9ACTN